MALTVPGCDLQTYILPPLCLGSGQTGRNSAHEAQIYEWIRIQRSASADKRRTITLPLRSGLQPKDVRALIGFDPTESESEGGRSFSTDAGKKIAFGSITSCQTRLEWSCFCPWTEYQNISWHAEPAWRLPPTKRDILGRGAGKNLLS